MLKIATICVCINVWLYMELIEILIQRDAFQYALSHRDILPNLRRDYACLNAPSPLDLLPISLLVPVYLSVLKFLLFSLSTIQEFALKSVQTVPGLIISVELASLSVLLILKPLETIPLGAVFPPVPLLPIPTQMTPLIYACQYVPLVLITMLTILLVPASQFALMAPLQILLLVHVSRRVLIRTMDRIAQKDVFRDVLGDNSLISLFTSV